VAAIPVGRDLMSLNPLSFPGVRRVWATVRSVAAMAYSCHKRRKKAPFCTDALAVDSLGNSGRNSPVMEANAPECPLDEYKVVPI
jgi:hypothetical protein